MAWDWHMFILCIINLTMLSNGSSKLLHICNYLWSTAAIVKVLKCNICFLSFFYNKERIFSKRSNSTKWWENTILSTAVKEALLSTLNLTLLLRKKLLPIKFKKHVIRACIIKCKILKFIFFFKCKKTNMLNFKSFRIFLN